MRRSFVTCDVFTDTRFGGNPLAVLPRADGLDAGEMQRIAREFNYSETTFVLPPERGGDRRVRIFTPAREVPFAGHPNVGTAFVLALLGELGPFPEPRAVVFEERAGDVPVQIAAVGHERYWCELRAPAPLSLGAPLPVDLVAAALGLGLADIRTDAHPPRIASVGLEFVVVEVTGLDALGRARVEPGALQRLAELAGVTPDVHVYARVPGPPDIRARMFAPADGVPEDPATGSANAALAGLLADLDPRADAALSWTIAQGVEMGRPSRLEARAAKRGGTVTDVWIGGQSVLVAQGEIEI